MNSVYLVGVLVEKKNYKLTNNELAVDQILEGKHHVIHGHRFTVVPGDHAQ